MVTVRKKQRWRISRHDNITRRTSLNLNSHRLAIALVSILHVDTSRHSRAQYRNSVLPDELENWLKRGPSNGKKEWVSCATRYTPEMLKICQKELDWRPLPSLP
jgi:hypothetical protein